MAAAASLAAKTACSVLLQCIGLVPYPVTCKYTSF